MKKAAHGLLTAEKVFDIIGIVLYAVLSIVMIIPGAILMGANVGLDNEETIALFSTGASLLGYGVGLLLSIPVFIASLILVHHARVALETSKTRAEARKGAVCAIVAGALANNFAIPAGVLMLCMKDAKYQEQSNEQPQDEVVG